MDTIEKNQSYLKKLQQSFPKILFKPDQRFRFHPPKTVFYDLKDPNFPSLILHELGHATIDLNTYQTDIERLKIEQKAWEKAEKIAENLNLDFDPSLAEIELDSYRDWLHKKSLCKKCGLTRFETPDGKYHCPNCDLF